VAGGLGQGGDAAHEGAANAKNVDMHGGVCARNSVRWQGYRKAGQLAAGWHACAMAWGRSTRGPASAGPRVSRLSAAHKTRLAW
jgi:hypothetical protein